MLEICFGGFVLFLCIFLGVMLREPRGLRSGFSFFMLVLSLGAFLLAGVLAYSSWFAAHAWMMWILLALAALAALLVVAFPLFLLVLFLVEGVRVVRHEGLSPSNLLSLGFAALWFGFLFVWPAVGVWSLGSIGTAVYVVVSFSAVYMLFLMAVYALSALLNLHLKKRRGLSYIVVLGSGLAGDKVTPLLAGRIERGIALLKYNPQAVLVMSGCQGPGEDVPESDAMAAYALERGVPPEKILREGRSVSTEENLLFSRALMAGENPRVALVTTAYHVFRALLLAKSQGLACVGFGSKTKWYFTLNAWLREFAGYVSLTRKRHMKILGGFAALVALLCAVKRFG